MFSIVTLTSRAITTKPNRQSGQTKAWPRIILRSLSSRDVALEICALILLSA